MALTLIEVHVGALGVVAGLDADHLPEAQLPRPRPALAVAKREAHVVTGIGAVHHAAREP